jgi:hypothetical protein
MGREYPIESGKRPGKGALKGKKEFSIGGWGSNSGGS